jgi:hypothetical protein
MASYTLKGTSLLYPDGPITKGRFNPACREDVISRNTWKENVTNGDATRHTTHNRKRLMKTYPQTPLSDVDYYLEKERANGKYATVNR